MKWWHCTSKRSYSKFQNASFQAITQCCQSERRDWDLGPVPFKHFHLFLPLAQGQCHMYQTISQWLLFTCCNGDSPSTICYLHDFFHRYFVFIIIIISLFSYFVFKVNSVESLCFSARKRNDLFCNHGYKISIERSCAICLFVIIKCLQLSEALKNPGICGSLEEVLLVFLIISEQLCVLIEIYDMISGSAAHAKWLTCLFSPGLLSAHYNLWTLGFNESLLFLLCRWFNLQSVVSVRPPVVDGTFYSQST